MWIALALLAICALQANASPSGKLDDLKNAFEAFMQTEEDGGNKAKINEIEHVPFAKEESDGNTLAHSESLSYRLVNGGSPSRGRVEVFFGGQWGTVCDDGFSTDEALVICRTCGYGMVSAVRPRAYFGEGDSGCPIWLDDVDCRGDENELSHCAHLKLGSHNCQHYEDVGVECSD